jgi:acetolactate synthase I/II/III large subunit
METGGDIVVRTLKAAGVEIVFGIISIHNMPIYDAIYRQGGIRVVPTRSEPGAVNMADGYAKATGKLGVAITSTGTGAGNAAGALVEAQTAGTPILHLTGQIDSAYLEQGRGYIHECKDQLNMLRAVSKVAHRVYTSGGLAATLYHAINVALSAPMGVVSVEIPIDIQRTQIETSPQIQPPHTTIIQSDATQIEAAMTVLRNAKRPLIWAGSGVIAAGATAELQQLAERWSAGVLTSQAGRGALPEDHPQLIGNFGNNPALKDFLQSCDVLLAVGTRFRGQETLQWKLPLPAVQVQIDADPLAIGRCYPATAGVVADAKPALRAILENMKPATKKEAFLKEIQNARESVRVAVRATLGPYEQIMDDLRAGVSRDALLVRDITISSSTWGSRLFPVYAARQSLHAAGGGIGQGLQMALGAKLGAPDKTVIALCGDGGFVVNCGEMATAVQENIDVVVLLFNDGGYGVIRNIQGKNYGNRTIGVNLHTPDFMKLAEAFGWQSYRVGAAGDFKAALHNALAAGRPAIIEIDMASVGEFAVPFSGPAQQ